MESIVHMQWGPDITWAPEHHLGIDDGGEPPEDIPEVIQDIWDIILVLDKAGKEDLRDRERADWKKAWRKEKKAEKKAKKGKGKGGKKKKRRGSSTGPGRRHTSRPTSPSGPNG